MGNFQKLSAFNLAKHVRKIYFFESLKDLYKEAYSSLPNKRTGWNFNKNQISVQGGILIKILECRVKTSNFVHNKRDLLKMYLVFLKIFPIRPEYLTKILKNSEK